MTTTDASALESAVARALGFTKRCPNWRHSCAPLPRTDDVCPDCEERGVVPCSFTSEELRAEWRKRGWRYVIHGSICVTVEVYVATKGYASFHVLEASERLAELRATALALRLPEAKSS